MAKRSGGGPQPVKIPGAIAGRERVVGRRPRPRLGFPCFHVGTRSIRRIRTLANTASVRRDGNLRRDAAVYKTSGKPISAKRIRREGWGLAKLLEGVNQEPRIESFETWQPSLVPRARIVYFRWHFPTAIGICSGKAASPWRLMPGGNRQAHPRFSE